MDDTQFSKRKISLFGLLIQLTFLFLLQQLFYFLTNLAHSGIILTLMLSTIPIQFITTKAVISPVIHYLFFQILLYGIYISFIWYLAHSISQLCLLQHKNKVFLGVILWVLSVLWILTANSLYFHHSMFAIKYQYYYWVKIIYKTTSLIFIFSILLSLFHVCISFYKRGLIFKNKILIIIFFVLGLMLFQKDFHPQQNFSSTKPNIIIVSIEALRPDFIFPLEKHQHDMPFLIGMLNSSTVFANSYTPIAQSFPSWVSLITAKTPKHNGARSLYTHYNKISFQGSLLEQLKKAGYETIYAVDGQRFGEITQEVGFDHVISPPYGASELLIGYISDFPLSNVLSHLHLGRYIYPYTYANRSLSVTYFPKDFIELIKTDLEKCSHKPLFLATHFSLSHWPYFWANDKMLDKMSLPEQYQYSLHAVDQQIQKFFVLLKNQKILDHAILVFMSDHGIGLGMPGDRLTNEKNYVGDLKLINDWEKMPYSIPLKDNESKEGIDTSYGYSTDILSLHQYKILLALKTLGIDHAPLNAINMRTSLMDIAPTLLDFLHLPPIENADGISLIDNKQINQNKNRPFFFENGFTTPEIATANISSNAVLKASMQNVLVDEKTGLVFISDEAEKTLLKNKQRAILSGNWMLAHYPQLSTMVLVNIATKKWTIELSGSFAKQAPISDLLGAFYGYNQD